jgi:hypothetical protein
MEKPMFRRLKAVSLFVALIGGCVSLSSHAQAQDEQPSGPYVAAGVDCNAEEHAKSLLDHAALNAGEDKSLIIVARLGRGESSRNLIRRRLSAPSKYLVDTRGVSKSRVITAEGERVRGPGQVEVYVGGELRIIFKMKQNRDFGQGPRCKIAFD